MEILQVIVSLAVFIGMAVIFPLWASKEAERKGLITISKIAKISIFFLMGWVGGLVAFIAAKTQPEVPGAQRIPRQKTWLDNLMESGLMILVGIVVALIGYGMWQAIESGTEGVLVIGFIPLPIEILPILALVAGIFFGIYGTVKSAIVIFKALIQGDRSYK